jgi:hypothetical protein
MPKLVKLTSKNQLTLPTSVVQQYPDIEYFEISVSEGNLVLSPVRPYAPSQALSDARKKFKALGLSEQDIQDAVSEARKA